MKITIDMENLENRLEGTLNQNIETTIKEAFTEVVSEKVETVLEGETTVSVSEIIEEYVRDYIETAKVQVGNSFRGEEVKEYTVEEYLRKQIADIFENEVFVMKKKDRWGDPMNKRISFKEYLDEYCNPEKIVTPYIEKMAAKIKDDVNCRVKSVFDETMRTTLAENVFAILSASDTYRNITNNLKLLGE